MTFFLGYINTNLPAVSYLKAIDLYLFVCLLLISFGVFESIIIYALIKLFNNEETKEYLKVNQLDIFLIKVAFIYTCVARNEIIRTLPNRAIGRRLLLRHLITTFCQKGSPI